MCHILYIEYVIKNQIYTLFKAVYTSKSDVTRLYRAYYILLNFQSHLEIFASYKIYNLCIFQNCIFLNRIVYKRRDYLFLY